jgi:hypothetical protein
MDIKKDNHLRIGRATSSEIFKLTKRSTDKVSFGEKALTYIEEINLERKMGVSLEQEKYSRPMAWGNFLERRVHNLLPMGYRLVGHITLQHPSIDWWAGSPDELNDRESVAADIKCYERKKFGQYVENLKKAKETGDVSILKKHHDQEYWQLISNAILMGMDNIEAIVYMPYESELEEIRKMAENYDKPDQWKYKFIYEAPKEELAYLKDGGYYKNLNIFRFPVPAEDVKFLTDSVKRAGNLLYNPKTT